MPEDIPERHSPLSDDERLSAASDWSDYRKDYGVHTDTVIRRREHQAFLAGWEARRNSSMLTPAQEEAVARVRAFVTQSVAAVSVTEALFTDASDRAERATLDGTTPLQRAAYEEAAQALRDAAAREEEPPAEPTAADVAAMEVDDATGKRMPGAGWVTPPEQAYDFDVVVNGERFGPLAPPPSVAEMRRAHGMATPGERATETFMGQPALNPRYRPPITDNPQA